MVGRVEQLQTIHKQFLMKLLPRLRQWSVVEWLKAFEGMFGRSVSETIDSLELLGGVLGCPADLLEVLDVVERWQLKCWAISLHMEYSILQNTNSLSTWLLHQNHVLNPL